MFEMIAQSDRVIPEGLTLGDWITAGIIIAVTFALAYIGLGMTTNLLEKVDMDPGPSRLLARFLAGLIFAFGLVYALGALDVGIGPVIGALGVGGLALAFALQDIVENFIAGILLQVRRPFSIGDQVVVGDHEGKVEDVNLRATVLNTYDGRRVFVPSAVVLKNPIENNTAFDKRRTTLSIGVAYETDLETARDAILEALADLEDVIADPAPQAYVEAFGGSSIDFAVRFWHKPPIADMWSTRDRVAVAIKKALDQAEIDIPFPIRTLQFPQGLPVSMTHAKEDGAAARGGKDVSGPPVDG